MIDISGFISWGFNVILGWIFSVFALLLSWLPTSSGFSPQLTSGVVYFWNVLQGFNYIVPINELLQAFMAYLTLELIIQVFRLANWAFGHLRGSGSAR